MAMLIEMYEQQYGVLTADITSRIGKLPSVSGSERRTLITELDRHLEECNELLEQMELEVREMKATEQPRLRTRLESYRVELGRLQQEFKRARSVTSQESYHESSEHFSPGLSLNEEQKQRLLDNSERLERTGNHLTSGYQILLETEEIGSQVLRDLSQQRETIQKSRSRLRETDAELGRSSRLVQAMIARSLQHRFVLLLVGIGFCLVVAVSIYISATRDR
ncbi:vesicle transport through interaction with t-SNAREs homolog 1A-like [Homalodisca vitripennis]|uniref:vesicle transport through interaction with t-SNAREs homolog 1A-like n=1 Tax=Homalodisca vitripennis TaxID=197043 RepID=UPI001EEB9D65|nr:vesicle transport through interaction with t-SNAREs homolog 1A-like [Homalodisca vitripennis]